VNTLNSVYQAEFKILDIVLAVQQKSFRTLAEQILNSNTVQLF